MSQAAAGPDEDSTRLILFHKHPMSANMHFLYFQYSEKRGGVCAFKPLPKLAAPIDTGIGKDTNAIAMHPSTVKHWAEKQFGLDADALHMEPEFCEQVEVPNGNITVYLAGFKGYELPADEVKEYKARFISLMDCVGIAPVEMLLLQRAYSVIMGGAY